MSTPMTVKSRINVKPPDKGSFPLDHDGECKDLMTDYMHCLRVNREDNHKCRQQSKAYLQCRMEKNLMAKESWKKLGYKDADEISTESISKS